MSETNPYNAIVTAIPLSDEFLEEKGEEAENVWEVVLNVGKDHGISTKNVFLIFGLGPEVRDPDSGDSLGHFEVVRGRGKVVHLQQKMCTVRSNRIVTRQLPTNALLGAAGSSHEVQEAAPFKLVAVGDFARIII